MEDEQEIKGKKYELNDDLKVLAKDVLSKKPNLDIGYAKVAYMLVHPNINKTTAGRCIRANKELKFFSGYDYLIQMSGTLWEMLDEETQFVLMYHELKHISVDEDKDGNEVYKIRRHDVEDFSDIIDEHGIKWIHKIRAKAIEDDEKLDPYDVKI